MAKSKNFIVCILLLLAGLYSNGQGIVDTRATLRQAQDSEHQEARQTSLRDKVIDTALSQVGVRELTGHNDGKDVEKYLKVCGLGKGYAWCAAFVSWNYKVNKVTTFKTAWAPSWFPPEKVLRVGETPQKADLFGLWINKRIGHVGIIYKYGDKVTMTIEGNTNEAGSREGDGVYVKRRLTKQLYKTSRWIN